MGNAAPVRVNHVTKARAYGGLTRTAYHLCATTGSSRTATGPSQAELVAAALPDPAKVFDDLFFFG